VKVLGGTVADVYFMSHSDHQEYASMEEGTVDVPFLWKRLSGRLGHLSDEEQSSVRSALVVADFAHRGQRRKSGEPFITHPVEVACILGDLHLDADTIVAGLLHDTIEDTDLLSFEDIEKRFGQRVRRIVEAETRITKTVPVEPGESVRDVDFRHFFQSMSEDVSVLLVKLADRLHNMRTMDSMKSSKQKEKAAETLQVYAPLAELLQLESIKEELEELSLRYLDPEHYFELKEHLEEMQKVQQAAVDEARKTLKEHLEEDALLTSQVKRIVIKSRQKSFHRLYKLYKRLLWKLEGNQQLRQVAQLHVLLEMNDAPETAAKLCYYVMGLVHLLWRPIPGKVKDCIVDSAPSTWKGLITSVWPPAGQPERLVTSVEVLIQSSQMYGTDMLRQHGLSKQANGQRDLSKDPEIADEGYDIIIGSHDSAMSDSGSVDESSLKNGHSKSKTVSYRVENVQHDEKDDVNWNGFDQGQRWVRDLQRLQHEIGQKVSPREYGDCVRNDFLSPSVLVFNSANEPILLPKGATVLDFAYHIHTDIGNRAIGAKVDGCRVGPKYTLRNAQVVDLMLNNGYKCSQEYLDCFLSRMSCLQTTSAKKKLKLFLKKFGKQLEAKKRWSNSGLWMLLGMLFGRKDGPEEAEQPSPSEASFWIMIYCVDIPGLLADCVKVIALEGLNITKYSGYKQGDGEFVMKYYVDDPGGAHASALTSELEVLDGCNRVITGCTLPALVADPLGWLYPVNNR